MESGLNWDYNTLINELVQGMEKANQLKFHLRATTPNEGQELLLQRIIHSFDKALMVLKWNGSDQRVSKPASLAAQHGSSVTVDGSPKSEDLNRSFKDSEDYSTPKRRKLQPTWTQQVRVNSENGLEGPTDVVFSWRKYGQKDILGAKYPRSYYRCTYRSLQNCWATKQVQRSDDDPSVFEITYKGNHTCNQSNATVQPSTSLSEETKEIKQNHSSSYNNQPPPPQERDQTTLMNLKANLRVSTENIAENENVLAQFSFPCHNEESGYLPIFASVDDENYLGAYSDVFVSPATSGSNYFSHTTYHNMSGFEGLMNFDRPENNSDIAEIISGHASTTNSPIGGMDSAEFDPNFRF